MNKRKWLAVLIVLAMMVAFFPAMGFAETHNNNNGCDDYVTLYAGQNIPVGTVRVSNDCEYLYVKYCIADEYWEDGDGWGLYETNVHVGEELGDFPINRGGNPRIGHFTSKATHEGVKCYTEEILLADWEADDELLIAAHSVVKKVTLEQNENESAWGAGTRFVEGGNWATYFDYTVKEHLMDIAAWTYTGPGTTNLVQSGCDGLLFDYDLPYAGLSGHWWTVSSISTCDQTFNFDWEYDYWHSWFLVDATLIAYAKQPDGTEQTIELYGVNNKIGWGPQLEEGSSSLTLNAGEEFGFRIYGYNWDSSNYLKGSLLIKKTH